MENFKQKLTKIKTLLFDIDGFRLIDGDKLVAGINESERSYFLFNDNVKEIYELNLK